MSHPNLVSNASRVINESGGSGVDEQEVRTNQAHGRCKHTQNQAAVTTFTGDRDAAVYPAQISGMLHLNDTHTHTQTRTTHMNSHMGEYPNTPSNIGYRMTWNGLSEAAESG